MYFVVVATQWPKMKIAFPAFKNCCCYGARIMNRPAISF
jgi:hypothetical protein